MPLYRRGPVTALESSASLVPCNLNVDKPNPEKDHMFCVIHKHIAVVGRLGCASDTQKVVSFGKVEDKSSSSFLTQVRPCSDENAS